VQRCLEKDRAARYQTVNELSQALSGYLARRSSAMPRSAAAVPPLATLDAAEAHAPFSLITADARHFEGDDEEIRIPGVRNRWPAVLILSLGLVAAGMYQAERSGKLRIRELAQSTLAPQRLAPDGPIWTVPDHFQPATPLLGRGVYATEPTRDASGAPALRAEPERDKPTDTGTEAPVPSEAPVPAEAPLPNEASPPVSDAERAAKDVYPD